MNNDISSDQENMINEILETGIKQIKKKIYDYNEEERLRPIIRDKVSYNTKRLNYNSVDHEDDEICQNNLNRKNKLKVFLDDYNKKYVNTNIMKYNTNNSDIYNDCEFEIRDLQTNIDKLERKLFKNENISINSPLSTLNNNNLKTCSSNKNNENSYKNKNINRNTKKNLLDQTKNVLEKSNKDSHYTISSNENSKISINNDQNVKIPDRKKYEINEDYSTSYKSIENSLYDNKISFLENEISEKQNTISEMRNELFNIKCERDKYEQISLEEKEKCIDLYNEISRLNKIVSELDHLNLNFRNLNKNYLNLSNKYEKSETIRNEQNKLIKSLQREIDLMRNEKITSTKAEFKKSDFDDDERIQTKKNKSKKIKKRNTSKNTITNKKEKPNKPIKKNIANIKSTSKSKKN